MLLDMAVRFVLNGKSIEAASADPAQSLLVYLRNSGRTGSKEGCAEGECGACAVALVKESGDEGRFLAVNSCLLPLQAVDGRAVVTVEGVAEPDGTLHPVQEALIATGGSQCGYCTPGFVMSMFCEYHRPDRRHFEPEAISGNLCRCTGYRPIVEAARALLPAQDSAHKHRLMVLPNHAQAGAASRPTSLQALWQARADAAQLIAGGTDLMVDVNLRGTRFERLVALESIAELRVFDDAADAIELGAALTLSELERLPHGVAMIDQLLPNFASRLIRNRATLGGNLGTASPIGDAAPVLLALDAELRLVNEQGARTLALRDFFVGYRKTALLPGELIASVRIPKPLATHQRFYKVAKRSIDDISTVSAAFALALDERGRVATLRMAFGGIAATPLRAFDVEATAIGEPWTEATIARLARALRDLGTPLSDVRGSAAYRREVVGSLLHKLFVETAQGAAP